MPARLCLSLLLLAAAPASADITRHVTKIYTQSDAPYYVTDPIERTLLMGYSTGTFSGSFLTNNWTESWWGPVGNPTANHAPGFAIPLTADQSSGLANLTGLPADTWLFVELSSQNRIVDAPPLFDPNTMHGSMTFFFGSQWDPVTVKQNGYVDGWVNFFCQSTIAPGVTCDPADKYNLYFPTTYEFEISPDGLNIVETITDHLNIYQPVRFNLTGIAYSGPADAAAPTPEPGTWILIVIGLAAIAISRISRFRACAGWLVASALTVPLCHGAWTVHNDPAGFVVRHPQGWTVETGARGLVRVVSGDRQSAATIQPFTVPRNTRASQWIDGFPPLLSAVVPQGRLAATRQISGFNQALAFISGVRNGEPVRAAVLVWIHSGAGMLYAISAPSTRFAAARPELTSILESFSYQRPLGGGHINWTRFADPNDNAFWLEVPSGWRVSGGTHHKDAIDTRTVIHVTSPDNDIAIRYGDPDVPMFTTPSRALDSVGRTEGAWYKPNQVLVRRYMTGTEFAQEYVRNHVGPSCAGIRFVAQQNRPDIDQMLQQAFPNVRSSHGEVAFTCARDGRPMNGWWLAGTVEINPGAPGGSTWLVSTLSGYLAAESKHEVADAMYAHIVRSFRQNPQWIARQRHLAMEIAEQQARQSEALMNQLERNYWARQRHWDESTRKFVNQIANRVDLVDPQTGERYQAADGHNYYWVDPISQRAGYASDLPFPPNVDFHDLVQWTPPS